jgi:hypothetical protein
MKTSVPVAESIPGDDDEERTDDDEREILIKLIPSVVETMKNHGQLETWIQFNQLLSTQSFPMDNIAFLLFLDVVRWYGTTSTTQMRYNDTAVNKFWRTGYKMLHGKWLRYMSGPKNKGDLVNRLSAPGEFDSKGSRINFSVPFAKITGTSESPVPSSQIRSGILTHLLDKVSEQTSKDQTFKLCFDGKEINVWSLLVFSDTLSSKWVNIPGRIWLDGTGDSEVPITFANGTLKFILVLMFSFFHAKDWK